MAGFYGGYMGNAGAMADTNTLAASPSFEIPGAGATGGLPGRSIDQLRRLQQSIPGGNIQIQEELMRRGLTPGGGPLPFPLAMNPTGGTQMGNAGFFAGPQYGQQMPTGFQTKTLS
jgi:hypothetical protein